MDRSTPWGELPQTPCTLCKFKKTLWHRHNLCTPISATSRNPRHIPLEQ